jgi:hypothetical protein
MNRMTAAGSALAPGQHGERQADVAGVVEQHRRHQRLRLDADQLGNRPGEQAAGGKHQKAAQRQRRVGRQIEGLAGHRREDQGRHEDVHVQPVGDRHFRLVLAA